MFLCLRDRRTIPTFIESLSKHANKEIVLGKKRRGTYLDASFTLEATVVLPMVAALLAFVLFFFRVMQVETQVYSALSYAGRKTAAMSLATDSDAAQLAIAEVYLQKGLAKYSLPKEHILGGNLGISILRSSFGEDEMVLNADYIIRFPIGFFGIKGIPISQTSVHHLWCGDITSENAAGDWVYVTKEGVAYHKTLECSYLRLSIQTVPMAQIQGLRNESEHKYYACSYCAEENTSKGFAYITDYGEFYHYDLDCIGLKRSIRQISIEDAGAYHACPKCAME